MAIFPGPGDPGNPTGNPPTSSTPQQKPRRVLSKPTIVPKTGNIVIVSRYGELAALASRVGATLYVTEPWYRDRGLYQGIVPTVNSLREALDTKPAAILFDETGETDRRKALHERTGEVADALRERGYPVWGGGRAADLLEGNRAWGLAVMVACGLTVPKTVFFSPAGDHPWQDVQLGSARRIWNVRGHLPDAIALVRAIGGRWVLKPDNGASHLSYVAASPEDMVTRLEHAVQMREVPPDHRFVLQEYVKGVEVSTEVWVQNGELVGAPNGTMETKKAFHGDLGPNTGGQTSVVWPYDSLESRIVRETLGRAAVRAWLRTPTAPGGEPLLPYSGPLDLNCIISEDDHRPYGIEWTPRFGYPAIFPFLELVGGDLRQVFIDLAQGNPPTLSPKPRYGYAIRVQVPPAPYADQYLPPKTPDERVFVERLLRDATHVRIGGPVDSEHVWLFDVQRNGSSLHTAGTGGLVAEVTASARRIEEARDVANELFDAIDIADKFGRPHDGANRALTETEKLRDWGYDVGPR